MTLKRYVEMFIDEEALVRLWTEHKHGYGLLSQFDINKPDNIDDVCLARELLNGEHWLSRYKDCQVLGSNDPFVPGFYQSAMNLIIQLPEEFDLF